MALPERPRRRSSRRRLLAAGGGALLAGIAGCGALPGLSTPTGDLRVRVRNFSDVEREVAVRLYLDGADDPAFERSATVAAAAVGDAERQWPDAVEGVADETPYRAVAVVDGTTYETADVANCIADDGEVRGHETVVVSIDDGDAKLLADDCPAD